ncbi:MAG: hypothetical protein HYR91_09915 [Flavobacteriia bacterium]|nr:hypothetical protein [Flavobacteriia bacterium]
MNINKEQKKTTLFTGIIGIILYILSAQAIINSPYDPIPVMGSGLGRIIGTYFQTIIFIIVSGIIHIYLYFLLKKSGPIF